jgi:hypothetical protein
VSDLLSTLSHTPLPTILVVAGIFFWILAIAGSLAGKITVQRDKQKIAGLAGTALIVSGVVLFFQDEPESKTDRPIKDPVTTSSASPAAKPTTVRASGGPLIRPPPPGRSVWAVDKSSVYLEPTGDKRQFFFVEPSLELANQGAQSGALLFDGRTTNATYEGKLFVFAGLCGTREYDASGPITNDSETVTLVGTAPQIDPESCAKTGEQTRTLVFNYKRRAN